MNNKYRVGLVFVAMMSFTTAGCGQAMQAMGGNSSSAKLAEQAGMNLQKVEETALTADQAFADAEATLNSIVDENGSLHLPDSDGTITIQSFSLQSLTGLPEKLKVVLDKMLSKISAPVAKAKAMLSTARQQILLALGKLDPSNPDQAELIAKLNDMMAKLDAIEAKLDGVFKLLADRVTLLIERFDVLIGRLDPSNPLLALPIMELNSLRDVLVDFRDKLGAL